MDETGRVRPGRDADSNRDGIPPPNLHQDAQALADHGRLEEALSVAVQAYEASGEAESGFLVATVLREMGQDEEAIRQLEDLVTEHPDFILAHFTLGTLLQRNRRMDNARVHFQEALRLLERSDPASILPGTSGEMTTGRMLGLVSSLLERKAGR
jgi:chemotaxis protein methyltransferase CheR